MDVVSLDGPVGDNGADLASREESRGYVPRDNGPGGCVRLLRPGVNTKVPDRFTL